MDLSTGHIKTKKLIIILSSFLAISSLSGQQVLTVSAWGESGGNYGNIRYYDDASALNKKQTVMLAYADITGSPFWDDSWNEARLVLSTGVLIKVKKAKLNLYTQQVHFLDDNNTDMICQNNNIQKLIFLKNTDTTQVLAVFEVHPDVLKSSADVAFYKALNKGNFRLVELEKALIKDSDYNPLLGKKEKSFYTKKYYALASNEAISSLSSLNHENIFAVIKSNSDVDNWLYQNKNKLKKEADVISFLNFYNKQSIK
jgi:hypothetical protein